MARHEIKTHQVNGVNEAIKIYAEDEPGNGGANHSYRLTTVIGDYEVSGYAIKFQNGPLTEAGPNGVSNEALLAVVLDRLEGFEKGIYACSENATAITHIKNAMKVLHKRTKARVARGVEGTSTV